MSSTMNERNLPGNLRDTLLELVRFLIAPRAPLQHWRPTQSLSITRAIVQSAHTADRLIELIDTDGLVLAPPARLLKQIALRVQQIDRERDVEVGLRERRRQLTALEDYRNAFVTFERLARAYAKLKLESIVGPDRPDRDRTQTQRTAQLELPNLLDSFETSLRTWSHLVEKNRQVIVPNPTLHNVEVEVAQFVKQAADKAIVATEGALEKALSDLGECVDGHFAALVENGPLKDEAASSMGRSAFEPVARREAQLARVVE